MSEQTVFARASFSLAWWVNLLLTLVTAVASRTWALLVITLVDLCVGVTQLDGNVSLQLVLETDSLNAGNGLYNGGLSVSDVTDGTNVDGCCFFIMLESGFRVQGPVAVLRDKANRFESYLGGQ